LLAHRDEIEHSFGGPLGWEAKENNRSRTVFYDMSDGGWANPDDRVKAIEATVDSMIRLENAIKPHLAEAIAAGDAVAGEPPDTSDDGTPSLVDSGS
jgi:hypothetical protein